MKSTLVVLCLAGATVVAANTWRVGPGDVRVNCPMTIGGSFTDSGANPMTLAPTPTSTPSGVVTIIVVSENGA